MDNIQTYSIGRFSVKCIQKTEFADMRLKRLFQNGLHPSQHPRKVRRYYRMFSHVFASCALQLFRDSGHISEPE